MGKKLPRNSPCPKWKSGHKFNWYDHLCDCGAWEGNFETADQPDVRPEWDPG